MLSEIDRISYYADWGTLLGAVRHGGFVPWDDDLDICMKRDDYVRFRELADNQLPKGYTIHDYKNKEAFLDFPPFLVNSFSVKGVRLPNRHEKRPSRHI